MRAAHFHEHHEVRLDDAAPPGEKLETDEERAKPLLRGICGTDLGEDIDAIIVNPKGDDLLAVVAANTERGVDVAPKCVGLEASLNTCVKAVPGGGKVVQLGSRAKPATIDAMLWAQKDNQIVSEGLERLLDPAGSHPKFSFGSDWAGSADMRYRMAHASGGVDNGNAWVLVRDVREGR